MIGNAVPVDLAKIIAKEIYEELSVINLTNVAGI